MKANARTDRWRLLDRLFQQAAELDPSEWTTFLSDACGQDEELRSEVEALLAYSDKTLSFLKRPVENGARALAAIGRPVGRYVLRRVLGEGGMGTVYLAARADEQYEQLVAVKLMHAGPGLSQAILERFRTERQILANLNHPNIARLLDGGMTPDGLPYLVMEYIDGVPVDQYCRENTLPIAVRLELFRKICSAVDYAHKNLVVHRDIKPANVLVTENGTPKLLDFGIAKLLDPEHTGLGPAETRPTERLMTPEYASPEQIRGEPITTATDVYGLGVLLYHLLTGRHPFAEEKVSPLEIARQVCEVDPPLPSRASLGSCDAATLKGDLDHIVSMAMRKEPQRRYSSAAELGADVAAYLNGYPLRARPSGWSYRAGKFIRRHKLGVTAAVSVALLLSASSVTMAVLTKRANQERFVAEQERRKAERAAAFLGDMFQAATPDQARGKTVTARELLDSGAIRVDKELAAEPEVRASLLYSIADAYSQLGVYDRAQELAERSFKTRTQSLGPGNPATADSLFLFANNTRLKGEYAQAEPLFRQALETRRIAFGESNSVVANSLSSLGECLYLEGKDNEAEPALREALAIYRRLGPNLGSDAREYLARVLEKKGDYLEATQLLSESVEIDRHNGGPDSPDYTMALHNLGGALARLGDFYGAEARLRESLATERRVLGNGHPDLGYPLNLLGTTALDEGDWQTAEPLLRESLAIWSKLGANHPLRATGLRNWGRVLQAKGRYSEARQYFRKALIATQRSLPPDTYRATRIYYYLTLLEFDAGRYAEAETLARQTLSAQREVPGGESAPDTAWTMIALAETRVFQHDPQGAEPLLRRALEIFEKKLPPQYPPIMTAQIRLGEALIAEGKAPAAEPILREALASAYSPPFRIPSWQVGEAESAQGWCLAALGREQEAQRLLDQSQRKLLTDPSPKFREQAAAHLAAVIHAQERP
jgi:serine/threonine-protein kinase